MRAASTPSRSIAQWGRLQSAEMVRALGFTREQTPAVSTLHEVFKTLDVAAFEAALARWAQAVLAPTSRAIALDGKALRGIHGEELPGVRLVAAYDVETGLVLAQQGVWASAAPPANQHADAEPDAEPDDAAPDKTREPVVEADAAHQAELTLAAALLAALPLAGRVVTGDALYCQRTLCAQIRVAQGDYLFVVKGNQPTLLAEVALLFDQPPPGEVFAVGFSHGRHGSRYEERRLWASTALNAYLADLGRPGVGQVLRLERVCVERGQTTRQVRHLITSLPASVPAQRPGAPSPGAGARPLGD